jgi:hypothetical protein
MISKACMGVHESVLRTRTSSVPRISATGVSRKVLYLDAYMKKSVGRSHEGTIVC